MRPELVSAQVSGPGDRFDGVAWSSGRGVGGGDGMRADLDLDDAVAAGGADEFPVSMRRAIMIGGQKIQVGLSYARKTAEVIVEAGHGR